MKTPKQCENMADIRAEIDRLDRQVVALFGQRFTYVKAASKFSTVGSLKFSKELE